MLFSHDPSAKNNRHQGLLCVFGHWVISNIRRWCIALYCRAELHAIVGDIRRRRAAEQWKGHG